MTPEFTTKFRRRCALNAAGLTAVLATSCAMPQWTRINQHGLIPVLIDGEQSALAANGRGVLAPSRQDAVRVQAVATPQVVPTIYADAVPGRPGYVFSPHSRPRQMVDVRDYRAGEEVRCPFTTQPFLVPDFRAIADAARPAPVRPVRPVAEMVSASPENPDVIDHNLTRLEPEPEMKAVAPAPVEPVTPAAVTEPVPAPAPAPAATAAAAPARPAIPYGRRVPGRPGFVYSPHASKTQLVDVAGTAPGVVVKCPYTNKHFRVPEVHSEEVRPESAPAETADTPPAAPDKSAPAPANPAPESPPEPAAPAAPGDPAPALGSPR